MTTPRYARWIQRAQEARAACGRHGREPYEEIFAPPATEAEVVAVESTLGRALPASFRRVVRELSAHRPASSAATTWRAWIGLSEP